MYHTYFSSSMDEDLRQHIVKGAPPSVYYIPHFITEAEEAYLINRVNSVPESRWTRLSNRRLQNWGGLPSIKGMIPEPIPEWLESHCQNLSSMHCFDGNVANHVLVNEYLPGQGIMPHVDGSLYFPTVTTITLGSHCLLNFYKPIDSEESDDWHQRHLCSLLLEPRSLFISKDDMYNVYLHGIEETHSDIITDKVVNLPGKDVHETMERSTRISLTIRHVPKVLKMRNLFGTKR